MEVIWLVLFAAGTLLVRVGQALYYAGMSRSKNAAAASLRSAGDVCVSVVAFWVVGFAIVSQTSNEVFGLKLGQLLGWDGVSPAATYFAAVMLIGTAAVSGAMAERSKLLALAAGWAVLAGFVLPVTMFWTWKGWLARIDVVDAAGAGAIHLASGAFALAGAFLVGPRTGKYNRDGSTSMIPAHSVPLAVVGAMAVMVGFLPYVAGSGAFLHAGMSQSAAGRAAFNTLLSGAAGGLVAAVFAHVRYGKVDIGLAVTGLLGGLVASAAGSAVYGSPAAFVTGAVAGLVVPLAAIMLDLFGRVDDPAGGISIHGVGGAWGLIAAGVFAPGTVDEHFKHFGVNVLAIVVLAAFAGGVGFGLFTLLRDTIGLRSTEADEYDGLDLAEHDIGAYPDFQQTMIKSYHLREA